MGYGQKRDFPPLKMTDTMRFGKHKGRQIQDLLQDEPDYLVWPMENTDVKFDDEVTDEVNTL